MLKNFLRDLCLQENSKVIVRVLETIIQREAKKILRKYHVVNRRKFNGKKTMCKGLENVLTEVLILRLKGGGGGIIEEWNMKVVDRNTLGVGIAEGAECRSFGGV